MTASVTDGVSLAGVPRAEISVLGLLTIVAYGSWFYGFGVLLDDIADDLGSGVGVVTAGYAAAQVLTGVLGLVAGRVLDRRGAKAVFTLGAASGPAVIVASSAVHDAVWFAVLFGVGGGIVGATSFYHLTQSIAARVAPGHEARAIARLTIWGAFSSPLLIPLTELSRRVIGWRSTLRLGALCVAVVLMIAAVVVDRRRDCSAPAPSPSSLVAIRAAVRRPDVRRLALSSLAGSFGSSVLIVLQIPAMVAAGLERSTAATFAGARGIAQLLGRLPLGRVLDVVPARIALAGSKSIVAVGAVVLAFAGNPAMAILFVLLAGTGIGAVSPLEGIYAREVLPADDLGTLMGALHLLLGLAAGAGPLLAAVVVDVSGSPRSGPLLAAAFVTLGVVPLLRPRTGALE